MQTKTLLLIIIKVLGLFFLWDLLPLIPQLLSVFAYGWLAYVMLFRTAWVMERLQFENELEETVDVRFHQSTVLQLAVLVVGGWMVLTTAPGFVRHLFLWFQFVNSQNSPISIYPRPDNTLLIVSVLQIVIGLLLVGYYRRTAAYLVWKRRHEGNGWR